MRREIFSDELVCHLKPPAPRAWLPLLRAQAVGWALAATASLLIFYRLLGGLRPKPGRQ
jgi:hypothetical protein